MRIGFITMHRVRNCGSNLQAYALQYALEKMGHEAKIIDYQYFSPTPKVSLGIKFISFILDAFRGFPKMRQKYRFQTFQKRYYNLSDSSYSRDSIISNPPVFDIYMSGSDQVWNPKFVADDTNFMLSFVGKDKIKLSYASSFACTEIPSEYRDSYANALSQYKFITVREHAGIDIVKELTGKDAELTCDPVFLLDKNEWNKLIGNKRPMKTPYILVYILGYMYNPRPDVYKIIDEVQEKLGYRVIYLNGVKSDIFRENSNVIKDFGPIEFVQWIRNAEFVITDSFHCTAFSVLYNRPMMGIVKSSDTEDGRLTTLLKNVGAATSIVPYNVVPSIHPNELGSYQCDESLLCQFCKHSISKLSNMLEGKL